MLNLEEPGHYRISLLHLGFRPFFLLGAVFAVLSVGVWAWLYVNGTSALINARLPSVIWHGHEMIYGYSLAVIAGFLLTAVRNWTGVQTLHGVPLLLLALLWMGARLAPFFPAESALPIMALLDLGFNTALFVAVLYPIVKVRQWTQSGILVLLLLMLTGNGIFYAGLFGALANGMAMGLYTGLYLVVFLVMVMGRRVIPFFVEKGVDEEVKIRDRKWVDVGTLVLMPLFLVTEVFLPFPAVAASSALLLFVLLTIRVYDWAVSAIWIKPLLWSIVLAYMWVALGFVMKAVYFIVPFNIMLAVHSFAYGGIGLMTLSMMNRVTLGHTGRNVFEPPAVLAWMFHVLLVGTIVRVLAPVMMPAQYQLWIGLSQLLWILAFLPFVIIYTPMLIRPRVDDRYG